MPKDRDTRKPKGFTFCQYKRKEDAEDAIKGMNGRVSMKSLYYELCQFVLRSRVWLLYYSVTKCIYLCENVSNIAKRKKKQHITRKSRGGSSHSCM